MRKLVVFLLLTLGWVTVNGQVSPIKKVIPNHNYTVSELIEFINSDDPIVEEWMKTYVSLTQDALLKCGEDLFFLKSQSCLKDATMFIIEHSVLNTIDLNPGFKNSGRTSDNKMKFVRDPRKLLNQQFLSFEYGSCHKDLVKMNCFNVPDLPEMKLLVREEKFIISPPGEKKKDDWTFSSPKKVYGNEVPDLFYSPIKEKKFKWKPVIIVGGVVVGLGTIYGIYSLITNNNHHHGGPGGAPSTTYHERQVPVITPPVVVPVPVVPGGPGGAPPSPGGK